MKTLLSITLQILEVIALTVIGMWFEISMLPFAGIAIVYFAIISPFIWEKLWKK